MKKEFSAGGIVFNSQGQVLLIQNHKGYWQFPKGHIEKDETKEEAALREVREEGGVNAKIVREVGTSKYIYTFETGEKISKIVDIFLMEYISGDIKDHDHEVSQTFWTDPKEALEKLTFSNDKKLLQRALTFFGS